MNFIGFHSTNNHIVSSEGHQLEIPLYLDDFFPICENKTPILYDLDGSVASILHHLEITKEQGKTLLDKGKLFIPPFSLTYYPQRFFSIDRIGGITHPYVNFVNANQVGYGESHFTSDNSIEDSFNKAKEAKQTAEEVYKVFQKLELSDTIVSPTSAFLKKYKFNWPTVDNLPVEVSQLAYEAVTGQWFEAYSMGHWGNNGNNGNNSKDSTMAYDYDLNASFLSIMADLPDIRRGEWLHAKEIDSYIMNNAYYGIATGNLTTDAEFHPFVKKIGEDNYTLNGTYPRLMTIQDLRFLDKWKLGNYRMDMGHFWIPKGQQYQPYRGIMNYLWGKRQGATGREKLIIQRIYSSIFGKSLERHKSSGFGELFNPIIGLTILNINALKVADACLSSNIVPLAVMADGFISDQPANVPISKERGQWKLNAHGKCIIAGTAAIAFENDKEAAELAIDYNDLVKQIKGNPKATEYKRTRWSPVTLALAIEQNWNELGEIKPIERSLNIGSEKKRSYFKRPKTGRDLISGEKFESMPHEYSMLINSDLE